LRAVSLPLGIAAFGLAIYIARPSINAAIDMFPR
jgi:hypothetical protein